MIYKKYNRHKQQVPSKSKWWCACDMRLVGNHGKCPRCGGINSKTKSKIKGSLSPKDVAVD